MMNESKFISQDNGSAINTRHPAINHDEQSQTAIHDNHSQSVPPTNFYITNHGVFYKDDKEDQWICSRLEVVALVRDYSSKNWGRLLEFYDADGKLHQWSMPMEMLKAGGEDLRGELLKQGLVISSSLKARNRLIEYITTSNPTARARCVSQTGWHNNIFTFPNCTIGINDEKVFYQGEHPANYFCENGTLEGWRTKIAKYCVGNSRLILAVSSAFAAILLKISKTESGGIHFVGESSSGKTTALRVAASVYGSKNYVQRWRATSNGIEGLAALFNDTLLILDELSQVDPQEAGEITYMLANGSGKARATKNGSAQSRNQWRILFLSAGEISLSQHIQSAGKRCKVGQEVRLIDLPAVTNFGIFENLHGFNSGSEFAQYLADVTNKYYGTAAIHFLTKLTREHNLEKFPDYIKQRINGFVLENLPIKSCGQVVRVCERFALIAIAGELATHYGITGWPKGEATLAASECYQSWVQQRGGLMNQERNNILAQVRAFFEAHGSSRFELIGSSNQQINNRVGFKKVEQDKTWYYVLPEAYRDEICKGLDSRIASKILIEQGWLETDSDGKATRPIRLPGMPRTRCYVFTQKIWENN